ncbi:endocuticle structural glycoprotein SgAbd-5-like [Chironomus tepperi]|uniref:endocuticle structural glycoprotein SgAbd-5-like n=1 Tax=Chironomus tepperi TaxID=113505 RepID=UPI00391FC19A
MFRFFVATLLVAYVYALPQQAAAPSADAGATLVSNTFADDGAGNFNFAFETSNGIKEQAQGQLKDVQVPVFDTNGQKTGDQPGKAEVQTGQFSYTAPDGTPITVQWVADENGFQPKGDHLPVAPQVPAAPAK